MGFMLLELARCGDFYGVKRLIQRGWSVNATNDCRQTALYLACENGHTGVAQLLLESGASVHHIGTASPLIAAVRYDHYDCVKLLLQHDANVNCANRKLESPMDVALEKRHYSIILLLLQYYVILSSSLIGDIADIAIELLKHAQVEHAKAIQKLLHIACSDAEWNTRGVGGETGSVERMLSIIRQLLQQGVNVNAVSDEGDTALYRACKSQQLEVVQMLLEAGADVNLTSEKLYPLIAACDSYQSTMPVLCAAVKNDNETMKHGANVNNFDNQGNTALHMATSNVVIEMLLNAGANVSATNDNGETALSVVCEKPLADNTDTSTAEKLLSAGANVNVVDKNGASPLYLACKRGKTEFVKLLLSHGANPNIGTTDNYPIHAACRGHHYDSVKLLLDYKADVNVLDSACRTALHHTLESETHNNGDSDKRTVLVQLLLDTGANVNAPSENGETPVYIACSKGLESIAKKMLECGAKVDGNSSKKLPLTVACENKHVSVVQLLLTNGANPNAKEEDTKDRYRCSLPLHIAADDGNVELVELLLKHYAKAEVTDTQGNTALHHAVENYHSRATSSSYSEKVVLSSKAKSVVDILLENNADVNIANSSGETPLHKAASRALLDVTSNMLQVYRGNPNKGSLDKNPLIAACLQQNVELVDTLLKHGADPNLASKIFDSDSKRSYPLFAAADKGNIDITRLLLNAGANVNAMNDEGKSILCLTAENLFSSGYYDSSEKASKITSTIRLLLQHGANVNMVMPDGRTILSLAVTALGDVQRRGDWYKTVVIELLQLMVKHGAMLQVGDIGRQSLQSSGILAALATFDGRHEFIVDLFRAGAGFQLTAFCCNAVATIPREAKSISLCQAAVLAGYSPCAEELQHLQLAAASDNAAGHQIQQLVNWLNEDRQQVPSLLRQCRVVIRRQLSVAVHFQTILPAIEGLDLPDIVKLYLEFDGILTEFDLSVDKELQNSQRAE